MDGFRDWVTPQGDGPSQASPARDIPRDRVEAPAPISIKARPFAWRDPTIFPRRRMLYGSHFYRKFLSCTFAPGGVGKSSLALVEAVAMAAGRDLLGKPVREGPLRAWYWNGEDPLEEIERRVAAICIHYGITAADLGDRLYLNSGRETGIVLATTTRGGTVIAEPVIAALRATILEERIDVVVLDPFVCAHQVPENDNGAVSGVCAALGRIADACNCAIELVHHSRKTGGAEVTVEDGRGASAMLAAARSARVLNGMTKDEAKEAGVEKHRSYFRLDNGKANLAPPPDKSDWFHLRSVPLGNDGPEPFDTGDYVAVVTPWTWPDALASLSVADLRRVQEAVSRGRWKDNIQATSWVGKAVAEALRLDVDDKGHVLKIKALLRVWIKSGALKRVEAADEHREMKLFVEVGTWATE